MTKKTLDEHAEEVRDAVCTADVRGWPAGRCPLPEVVAAYEAERAARIDLERQYLCAKCQHNEARVRELEAERAGLVTAEAYGQATAALAETRAQLARLSDAAGALVRAAGIGEDEAVISAALVVDLAAARMPAPVVSETRAQLARLREAALMLADRVRAEGGHGHRVHELSDRVLDALSTPGPTLASVRAEALRDAARRWMADHENSTSAEHVHDWLRQRAADLEAGRE